MRSILSFTFDPPPVEWTHLWFKLICYLCDCDRPTSVRTQNQIIFEMSDGTCTVFSQRALPTLSALFTVSVFVVWAHTV